MPLDPDVAAYLDRAAAMGLAPYEEQTPTAAREQYLRVTEARRGPAYRPEPLRSVSDHLLHPPGRELAARAYRPFATAGSEDVGAPLVVFFHGGGWVIGDLDTHDGLARAIARALGAIVLSVAYRLAPEHPFPAAVDDAVEATVWAAEHARELGAHPTALVVAGDSAGGALATVVARRARDAGGPALAAQLLLYPVTDLAMTSASYREHAGGYGLTAATMAWFVTQYGAPADTPDASPVAAAADDLAGLPPAVISTAEYDPLRDEGDAYARALAAAGVPTRHLRHDGLIHAYALMETIPAARTALAADLAALAALLGSAPEEPELRIGPETRRDWR